MKTFSWTKVLIKLFNFRKAMASQELPQGYSMGDIQVAGHMVTIGNGNEIGLLKRVEDGSVLKPEGSPFCAKREIQFYESLSNAAAASDEDTQTYIKWKILIIYTNSYMCCHKISD